jgi:acyl-coenzyme A synthetase/AMP-(fatty) acid ligase
VLIRQGMLPKTTSGKIQRSLARRLWLEGRLEDMTTTAD